MFLLHSFRHFWRNRSYNLLNVFGLATGIACAAFIFLWIEDELRYDSVYPKKDRLYEVLTNFVSEDGQQSVNHASSAPWAEAIKSKVPGVVATCRMVAYPYMLSNNERTVEGRCTVTDPSFFNIFDLPFIEGSKDRAFTELYNVVITEGMAKKLFGSGTGVIGKPVNLNNDKMGENHNYIVTGVMKDLPGNSTLQFDCVIPFEHYVKRRAATIDNWSNFNIDTYLELSPVAKPLAVTNKIYGILQANMKTSDAHPVLFNMNDWRLHDKFENGKQSGGRITYVRLFGVIAWIILLIACINFMNLATARSEKRALEVGIRKVMGSARHTLILRFISESVLMAFLAVLTGIFIVSLLLPQFNILVEKQLTPGLDQPLHLLSLLAVAIVCGLVAGSYPAFYLSSFRPIAVLKGFKSPAGSAGYIRKGLVVFQFAVSILLITGSIIIYRQIRHVQARDLGYNKDNLVMLNLHSNLKTNFTTVLQNLLNTGMVANAGMCSDEILYQGNSRPDYTWQGKDPSDKVFISYRDITPGFINTWGLQLLEGRDFYSDGVTDSSNVIITESLAKLMGEGTALGKTIQQGTRTYGVAGVVKDFVYGLMYENSSVPVLFRCRPQSTEQLIIRIKPGAPVQAALSRIEAVLKKENPSYPFVFDFVDEKLNTFYKAEILVSRLSGIFATLAIIISCLGLFGLAAYTAERRAREMSIRKVLGAGVGNIARLMIAGFLFPIVLAAAISFPLGWWIMNNWLQEFPYRTHLSIWLFILAGSIVLLIALCTIGVQSIRTATQNPVKKLRTE